MSASGRPASELAERLFALGAEGLVSAIDHLLSRNEWARNRLLMHVGRQVCVGIDLPVPEMLPDAIVIAEIIEGGRLRAVDSAHQEAPAVTMRLRPSMAAMRDLAQSGPAGLGRHLSLDGDILLAAAIGEIVRHLRLDPAEDLSRLTGDLVAHRIDTIAGRFFEALTDSVERVATGSARMLSADSSVLPARSEIQSFDQRLRNLETRIGPIEDQVRRAAAGT